MPTSGRHLVGVSNTSRSDPNQGARLRRKTPLMDAEFPFNAGVGIFLLPALR